MSLEENSQSYYSEVISFQDTEYLAQTMYGKNHPEDEEFIGMQQPLDALVEGQEILLQDEVLEE